MHTEARTGSAACVRLGLRGGGECLRGLTCGTAKIELACGDTPEQDTVAIVNAANTSLLGGGGVDGAIHRRGGHTILAACEKLGGCATGDAKITEAGALKAQYVIHAVGPVFRDGEHGEPELLARAYRRSLEVATEFKITSVAFPSISTGAYRFPLADAARTALRTVIDFLDTHSGILLVRFVLFPKSDLGVYEGALEEIAASR